MKNKFALPIQGSALVLIILLLSTDYLQAQPSSPKYQLVNPFVGTAGGGNTYPGASVPFGLVQLSPDVGRSGWYRIAGYAYGDSTIASFSHTHLSGTGAGDMYDIAFLPYVNDLHRSPQMPLPYALKDDHTERAHAGYYAVSLQPHNIHVELTATPHCGIQRYTYPPEARSYKVFVDLSRSFNWDQTDDSHIRQIDDYTIEGYRLSSGWCPDQYVYFRTRFSLPIQSIRIDERLKSSAEVYERCDRLSQAHITFAATPLRQLTVSTYIQPHPDDLCAETLLKHESNEPFDKLKQSAQLQWEIYLQHIEVSKPLSPHIDTTFYTALYHTGLGPIRFDTNPCDELLPDTDLLHTTTASGKNSSGYDLQMPYSRRYTNFSLWDTYRAVHPLFNLIIPRTSTEMTASLIESMGDAKRTDHNILLPRWPLWGQETGMMIGYHSASVIADSYIKGLETLIPGSLPRILSIGIRQQDMHPTTYAMSGQKEIPLFQRYGYVPADSLDQSVSHTLELSYTDACQSRLLKCIALDSTALIDSTTYRAGHYKQLYDSVTGFFRPRLADGRFKEPFNPFSYTPDYTESNAYQYLFSVQHDIAGLCHLMGGKAKMAARLDELFNTTTPDSIQLPIFATGMIGQYNHGNEPVHHVPYLYNYVRQPWKTTDLVHHICHTVYNNRPDGLCGNEDYGQMSAWYIFAAMGFYPVDPTSGKYELSSPLFGEIIIRSDSDTKPFKLLAHGLSAQKRYIQSVKVDGKPWKHSYITYEQIKAGATVELQMTDQPGIAWY